MLERAAEIVETENRPIQAAYFVSKKLQLWIQKGEFREAAEKAKKLIRLYQVREPTSCEKNNKLLHQTLNLGSSEDQQKCTVCDP